MFIASNTCTIGQLRTYSKFQPSSMPGVVSYLVKDLSWSEKRLIAQIRTGNHKLRIETGRHCRPRLQPEFRVCLVCNTDQVEDEQHFIADCNAYSNIRSKYLPVETGPAPHTAHGVDYIKCLTSTDTQQLRNVSRFIKEAWVIRETRV